LLSCRFVAIGLYVYEDNPDGTRKSGKTGGMEIIMKSRGSLSIHDNITYTQTKEI
jgi:hypothetical protein